jgi:hypothetical protein
LFLFHALIFPETIQIVNGNYYIMS